jgi:hypothetical protein
MPGLHGFFPPSPSGQSNFTSGLASRTGGMVVPPLPPPLVPALPPAPPDPPLPPVVMPPVPPLRPDPPEPPVSPAPPVPPDPPDPLVVVVVVLPVVVGVLVATVSLVEQCMSEAPNRPIAVIFASFGTLVFSKSTSSVAPALRTASPDFSSPIARRVVLLVLVLVGFRIG